MCNLTNHAVTYEVAYDNDFDNNFESRKERKVIAWMLLYVHNAKPVSGRMSS